MPNQTKKNTPLTGNSVDYDSPFTTGIKEAYAALRLHLPALVRDTEEPLGRPLATLDADGKDHLQRLYTHQVERHQMATLKTDFLALPRTEERRKAFLNKGVGADKRACL